MSYFCNEQTRGVFLYTIQDWHDPLKIAREWMDMAAGHAETAVHLLAKQLRKDLREVYLGPTRKMDDEVMEAFIVAGLRQVNWKEVAERLLERCDKVEKACDDGTDDGGMADAS